MSLRSGDDETGGSSTTRLSGCSNIRPPFLLLPILGAQKTYVNQHLIKQVRDGVHACRATAWQPFLGESLQVSLQSNREDLGRGHHWRGGHWTLAGVA